MPFIGGPTSDSKILSKNEAYPTDKISSTYVYIDDTFYEILKNHGGVVANKGAITYDGTTTSESYRMDTSYMFGGGTHGVSGAYATFVYNNCVYTAPYQSISSSDPILVWYKYDIASKTYTKFTLSSPYTASKYYYMMINHQIGATCKFYGLILTPGDGAWCVSTDSEFSYIVDDVIFDFDNNTITRISKFPTINISGTSTKTNLLNMFYNGSKTYIGVSTIKNTENYYYDTSWSNSNPSALYLYENESYTQISTRWYIDLDSLVYLDNNMIAISIDPVVSSGGISGSYEETLRSTRFYLQNIQTNAYNRLSSTYTDFNNSVTPVTDKIFPTNSFTDVFKKGLFYDFSVYMAYTIPGIDRSLVIDYTSNEYYGPAILLMELIPSDDLSTTTIKLIGTLDRSDVLETGEIFKNTPFINDGYGRYAASKFNVSIPLIPDFSENGVMYGANSIYDQALLCKYKFDLWGD